MFTASTWTVELILCIDLISYNLSELTSSDSCYVDSFPNGQSWQLKIENFKSTVDTWTTVWSVGPFIYGFF